MRQREPSFVRGKDPLLLFLAVLGVLGETAAEVLKTDKGRVWISLVRIGKLCRGSENSCRSYDGDTSMSDSLLLVCIKLSEAHCCSSKVPVKKRWPLDTLSLACEKCRELVLLIPWGDWYWRLRVSYSCELVRREDKMLSLRRSKSEPFPGTLRKSGK